MRCPVGNALSVGFGDWGLLRNAFSFLCYLKKKNELKGTQAVHILAAANEFILKKKKEKFQKFL